MAGSARGSAPAAAAATQLAIGARPTRAAVAAALARSAPSLSGAAPWYAHPLRADADREAPAAARGGRAAAGRGAERWRVPGQPRQGRAASSPHLSRHTDASAGLR